MSTTSPENLPTNIIDIEAAIAKLESNLEKNINAQPLLKAVGMHIIIIALNAGAELKTHTAPGPISVQVIRGLVSFRTVETVHELVAGQILTLEANIPHSVYALERSVFLVTKSIPA